MIPHRFFALLLSFFGILGSSPLFAQQDLSERILADHPAFVINRLDVVKDDLCRLGFDLLQAKWTDSLVKQWFETEGSGIDKDGGVIIYSSDSFRKQVIEYQLSDRKLADSHFEERPVPEATPARWRTIKTDSKFPFVWFMSFLRQPGEFSGLRIDDRLFIKEKHSKEDFDWLLADKPKLAAKMDPVSHEIINKSGFTIVVDKSNMDLSGYFDAKNTVDENIFKSLTETERKWLEDLADHSTDAEYALVGLKYHDRVMEMRTHVKLTEGAQLDDLFNIKETQKPWDVSLGFESQGLAGAIVLNMGMFKSPAAARAIPKVALSDFYHSNSTRFLNGSMLQLLSEFVGDSWNDLSAARLGIYENNADEKAGQLAVVAVVDAKDPQQVIVELKKISALAMRADRNAEAEAQRRRVIDDLIEALASDTDHVASRAETRLKFGGEVALKAVGDAMSNLNQDATVRAKRVVAGIERMLKSRREKTAVLDPKFWTTLNPKLEFKTAEKTADGFNAFSIEISPDPSKSEEQVRQASNMMKGVFGDQWNTIPVIQVDDHFVFMIGSNQEKLNQICRNVRDKKSNLLKHLQGVGDGSQAGQFQVVFNPEKLDRIFGISRRANWLRIQEKQPGDDEKLCWMGVNLQNNSLGAAVLLPIEQFQGFFNVMN